MSHWEVIYRSAWVVLAILFAIGVICMFWPQIRQYQEYQRKSAALDEEIRVEEELIKQLKRQQERMQHDPRFVEKVAHDLGMTKPDETIIKFVDDEPGTSPPHEDRRE